jgi:hypothetical protein
MFARRRGPGARVSSYIASTWAAGPVVSRYQRIGTIDDRAAARPGASRWQNLQLYQHVLIMGTPISTFGLGTIVR